MYIYIVFVNTKAGVRTHCTFPISLPSTLAWPSFVHAMNLNGRQTSFDAIIPLHHAPHMRIVSKYTIVIMAYLMATKCAHRRHNTHSIASRE